VRDFPIVQEQGPTLARQPALDGVRGIAVAMVLLFHLGIDWMPGQTEFALCLHGKIDGKLVAFPTETVYGLGANALDDFAVSALADSCRRRCSASS